MNRQRKIDEDLWEDSDEKLSADHVVERFFSQQQRHSHDAERKGHVAGRPRRRLPARPDADD